MNLVTKTLVSFTGAMLVLAGGAVRANASEVLKVNVPFAFVVEGQTLPAGQYRLMRDDMDPSVLRIQGARGTHATMYVLTNGAGGHDPDGSKPALSFIRRENQYQLSTIWESATEGRTLLGSK